MSVSLNPLSQPAHDATWMQWFDAMAQTTSQALKTLPAEHVLALHLASEKNSRTQLHAFAQAQATPPQSQDARTEPSFVNAELPCVEAAQAKVRSWQRTPSGELRSVLRSPKSR